MVDEQAIKKAQEQFGELLRRQLERVDVLKGEGDWTDYSKLDKLIIGVCGGDGIGPYICASAQRVMEFLLADKIKAGEVMQYDITQMSGVETEATTGMLIVNTEFSNTIDLSEILVISYNNADELTQAKAIYGKFSTLMTDKYGQTLTASYYGEYSKNNDGTGICLIAIACNEENYDVTHQTANIRGLVSEAKTSVGSTLTTYVTGNAAIAYDTEVSSMEDVSKVDPISIALIFVLLGLFFFALVTALVPPAVVGMAYGIALSAVFGIGCVLDVYYVTELLVLVTMLGAGCDYALFIISRYRDERRDGASHENALRTSIQWAGESVFTSGLAVIIGFGVLSICSFSMISLSNFE